jgi:hypothetical protein
MALPMYPSKPSMPTVRIGRAVTCASALGSLLTRCWVKKNRMPALPSLELATSRKRSRSSLIPSSSDRVTPCVMTSSAT